MANCTPQKWLSCTTRFLLLVAFIFLISIVISACVTFFSKRKVSCENYTHLLQVRDSNFKAVLQTANSTLHSSETLKDKLKQIHELSHFATKQYESHGRGDSCDFTNQTEICYTEECLDASLTLLKSINFSVDPCSDFYQFSCGGWIQENPVPPTASRWDIYSKLQQNVTDISRGSNNYRFYIKIRLHIGLITNPVNNSGYKLRLAVPIFSLPINILQDQTMYPSIISAYKAYFKSAANELGQVTENKVTDEELDSQFKDVLDFELRLAYANASLAEAKVGSSYLPQNVYVDSHNKSHITSDFNLKNQ